MSKEIKNTRAPITWEQKQRQRTPLHATRKSQKVISKTRQRHSFHKKQIFCEQLNMRARSCFAASFFSGQPQNASARARYSEYLATRAPPYRRSRPRGMAATPTSQRLSSPPSRPSQSHTSPSARAKAWRRSMRRFRSTPFRARSCARARQRACAAGSRSTPVVVRTDR